MTLRLVRFQALFVLLLSTAALADPIGTVDFVTGHVSLIHLGAKQAPQAGIKVAEGDSFVTAADGEIHLDMVDGAALSVRSDSSVTLSKYGVAENDNILITLSKGALRSVTGWLGHLRPSRYAVQTPTATIGIRGTDHETTYEPDGESAGTYERVFEGSSYVQTESGKTLDATPGIAVAGKRAGNEFRNVGEHELPGFILQRPRHDDRFEKKFSQKAEQRMRQRFSHHLSELNKRDPAAARALRQHMDEKYPTLREKRRESEATGARSERQDNRENKSSSEESRHSEQLGQRLERQQALQRRKLEARQRADNAGAAHRWRRRGGE